VTMTGALAVAIGGVLGAWSRWALSYFLQCFLAIIAAWNARRQPSRRLSDRVSRRAVFVA
jgi:membrane protein YqaA with SNARE-associated domain